MSLIRFNYADVKSVRLKNKTLVKDYVAKVFVDEGKVLNHLNYIFCSDSYLLQINRSFLKHDFFTDIVTFDLSEADGIVGEIYISIDRVRENAIIHSVSFQRELLRVIFHGVLHLCGYKDKKKSEITMMRQKEDYYLRVLEEKI